MSQKHPDVCNAHKYMLGKGEFRWVVGGLVIIFMSLIGFAALLFASTDRVNGIDDRVKKVEATLDVIKSMDSKLDALLKK
jgi:hypothetical protein